MISENPVKTVPTYATESLYMTPPNQEQIRNGVIPLDSLPAPWWNWLWNQLTINEGQTVNALNDILTELHNVLQSAGITPSRLDSSQLRQAIVKLSQAIGTDTTPGSVISSSVPGKVAIAADGTMTANGLGNINDLNTDVATSVVNAINWLYKNTTDKIGALTDLQTSDKTNLVSAINSNKAANDNTNTVIGTLSSLTTAVKTSIANAINSIVDGATKVAKAALADVASKVAHTLTINGVTFDGSADKSITINAATVQDGILKKIFKVGAYYITESSENPATTFGFGTWVELTEGQGIIQSGSTYTAGSTGGSNKVTLSTSNLPSHGHSYTPSGKVGAHRHMFTPSGGVNIDHSHLYLDKLRPRNQLTGASGVGTTQYIAHDMLGYLGQVDLNLPSAIKPMSCITVSASWQSPTATSQPTFTAVSLGTNRTQTYLSAVWSQTGQPIPSGTHWADFGHIHEIDSKPLAGTRSSTEDGTPTFTGIAANTGSTGSGTSFSVLNAYRAAHIWRRTA